MTRQELLSIPRPERHRLFLAGKIPEKLLRKRKCSNCNGEFYASPCSNVRDGQRTYCSKKCRNMGCNSKRKLSEKRQKRPEEITNAAVYRKRLLTCAKNGLLCDSYEQCLNDHAFTNRDIVFALHVKTEGRCYTTEMMRRVSL